MNDKDYIKELFQNKLGGHEVKVDPQLWQGIQAQLGTVASTGAAGSAAVAGKTSLLVKIGVAAAITSAALVTTYVLVTNSESQTDQVEVTSKDASSDLIQPSNEQLVDNEGIVKPSEISPSTSETSINDSGQGAKVDAGAAENDGNDPSISFVPDADPSQLPAKPLVDNSGKTSSTNPTVNPPVEVVPPLELALEYDKISNQHYIFYAESHHSDRVVWDFGDGFTSKTAKAEHVFNESGTFTITAHAYRNEEVIEKKIVVTVDVAGKISNLPSVFTPNNDGSNDEFFIESDGLLDFSVVIMNDKGEIIFESDAPDFRWDGRDRKTGLVADAGSYFYIITAKDILGNTISKHQRLQLKK